ncbi:DUF6473 family protein [Puniceibacterium sp. IMCC21224]|uniref:DUF6473 family protein n=1 Tax=Puniceibacterium sp. IMCC21224 TaxID=1618204 RepID=UPI00064D9262|nr:DUF6473 family protein [Puniceibacterium sp. IMCC21224]KMK66080.1 hypothetical protein IMCC21224_11926 [Puniceibacterium sp. IMCC21224]
MTYLERGQPGLEYYPCRYGRSKVLFRGPRRPMQEEFVAFLGGTETYGRFIKVPFPSLVEKALRKPCANFGAINAGLDLYINDPTAMEAAQRASVTVIQILGAQNMSNRFYSVHPRRNDRFLKASDLLQILYQEVDFTEFNFNRHMLTQLRDLSEERFDKVAAELRMAWVSRMKHILSVLRQPVYLLWFAQSSPSETPLTAIEGEPLFIDRQMIESLRPRCAGIIEVTPSDIARAMGTDGMIFNEFEACAAQELMGPQAHIEAADALLKSLDPLMQKQA